MLSERPSELIAAWGVLARLITHRSEHSKRADRSCDRLLLDPTKKGFPDSLRSRKIELGRLGRGPEGSTAMRSVLDFGDEYALCDESDPFQQERRLRRWSAIRSILVLTLWPLAIVITLRVYLFGDLGLIGRFAEHWPLSVPLIFVGLIIGGQFGHGYGLPLLFRDSPDSPWWDAQRSLLSGLGVVLLVLTVTTVVYFAEYTNHFDRIVTDWEAWPRHLAHQFGGRIDSIPDLIRLFDDPARRFLAESRSELILGARPTDRLVFFGALALPVNVVAFAVFQFWAASPLLLLLAICVLLPTPGLAIRARPKRLEARRRWLIEKFGYLLGAGIGLAIALACVNLYSLFVINYEESIMDWFHGRGVMMAQRTEGLVGLDLLSPMKIVQEAGETSAGQPVDATRIAVANHAVWSVGGFLMIYFAMYLFVLLAFGRTLSPSLGICMLLNLGVIAYLVPLMLAPSWQFGVISAFALAVLLGNSRRFVRRFAGMDRYYGGRRGPESGPKDLDVEERRLESGQIPDVGATILLSDRRTLEAWASRYTRVGRKPKLVLVTTTGGAYRAAFWTTTVLESLAEACPGALNHIRVITGASGGMVGAAYVVAMLNEPAPGQSYSPPFAEGSSKGGPTSPTERLEWETRRDSLTPIVRKLVTSDIISTVLPWPVRRDRGDVLDEQWPTLDRSFATLREGEREGWRPSLILAPMVAETGRRLLISNLDLFGLTEARGLNRPDISFVPEHDTPRLRRDQRDLEQGRVTGLERLYSRSAIEFFRAFPACYGPHHPVVQLQHHEGACSGNGNGHLNGSAARPWTSGQTMLRGGRSRSTETFRIATAVRMNASFPFISPAASLPVTPTRRVVDAGYYDNYGVDLAANWALQNRDWICQHTSGIALIQIRASRSEAQRKRIWIGSATEADGATGFVRQILRRVARGIIGLTTPPTAAIAALSRGMAYRNDLLVAELDRTFNQIPDSIANSEGPNESARSHSFFETFVFENPITIGTNWYITRDEICKMSNSMAGSRRFGPLQGQASHNCGQRRAFQDWFGDGLEEVRSMHTNDPLTASHVQDVGISSRSI